MGQNKGESNAIERDFARDRDDLAGDWVFRISHADHFDIDGRDPALILVDSGCDHHCCPLSFVPHMAIVAMGKQHAPTANRRPLYDMQTVPGSLQMITGSRAEINFQLFDAKRPILWAMMLAKQGFDIQHNAKQHHNRQRGRTIVMSCAQRVAVPQVLPDEADVHPLGAEGEHEHIAGKETALYDGIGGSDARKGEAS